LDNGRKLINHAMCKDEIMGSPSLLYRKKLPSSRYEEGIIQQDQLTVLMCWPAEIKRAQESHWDRVPCQDDVQW
jgi:hypothetical protein